MNQDVIDLADVLATDEMIDRIRPNIRTCGDQPLNERHRVELEQAIGRPLGGGA
jgi:hypothetical protein